MRRSGSPFTGLLTVMMKELSDNLGSARMRILVALILLTAVGAIYSSALAIQQSVGEDPFLFLTLFTTSNGPLPSFVSFLGFLVPLSAITLGFDAVNSEYSKRTLSRVLSQPIYRDALLVGKFLAGLITVTITLTALWLLTIGVGIVLLGLPPSGEEVVRGICFLLATIFYAGIWLVLAMFFSVVLRQSATSALASLAVWLLFSIFWPIVSGLISQPFGPDLSPLVQTAVARLSPNTLFLEITLALLNPATRTLNPVMFSQLEGAVLGAPLPLGQSILLTWPQSTGLLASMILLFALTYVIFQRQEIRA